MFPSPVFARSRRGDSLRRLLRRGIGGLLLGTYVFVAAGVPLPSVSKPAKSGEMYPCAASGCGCDSADKCWRSCCCHSLAERLAWARKNNVKPPAFALAEARKAGLEKLVNASLATKTCCSAKRSGCNSAATKSCCTSRVSKTAHHDHSDFIVAYRALGCHGQSLEWLAAVPSLITVELTFSDELAIVSWLGLHTVNFASPLADAPISPPPERA